MKFPGFVGQPYTLASLKAECQDCVNMYFEADESGAGAYGNESLVGTPGLRLFGQAATNVWRGLYLASNGTLYGVCGNKIYSIASNGTCTELAAAGPTPVTLNSTDGVVTMADNGTDVLLCHSTNEVTGSLYKIALATNVVSAVNVEAINVYKVFSLAFKTGRFIICGFYGSGSDPANGRFHYSDLNSTTFQALNFFTAESSPDRLNQVLAAIDYVWLGGERSVEVWQTTSDATVPFQRLQGAVLDIGTIGQTIARADNAILFLGVQGGTTKVYRMEGINPVRVSNYAIEYWLSTNDTTGAYAYAYSDAGHTFYVLTCPNTDRTWVYDLSNGAWHDRRSYDVLPGDGGTLTRHRSRVYARAFGRHIVGDYINGKLYDMQLDAYTDEIYPIIRQRTTPHVATGDQRLFFASLQLICQVGFGLDGGVYGSDPQVWMQYSSDGGHVFGNLRQAALGKIGEYQRRVIWRMLGSGRDRVFRIRISEPIPIRILGAEIEVTNG